MTDDAGRRLLRQLEAAQRLARMGSFEHDLRSGRSTWSPMMYELHGVPADYPAPGSASDYAKLVHPDDLPGLISASAQAEQTGAVSDLVIRVRHGQGASWRKLRVLFQCEHAPDGTPMLLSGTMQDVTGEVDAQAKTRFLTRVTHELRAPLAGVIGMIDLALADSTPEARADHLGSARASARHLLELIDDLLDASREDAWRINVVEIEFDLAEVVAQAVAMMVPRARRKRLRLAGSVADGVAPRRLGDPLRLRQILVNLLYNAVKFTSQGAVEARALPGATDDEVALVVEDTGVGIAPELQAAVFEPYVQGDQQPAEGVGLGLAITRELVSAMGGAIDLTSTPGIGTRFTVRLPLRRVAGDSRRSDRLRAIDQPSSPGEPTPVSPLRVLVADDNPTSAAIVQAILERDGHAVVWVTDGAAAVETAGADRFDVVLMDIEMPRLDGLGAARALRTAEHTGGRTRVPVVAMSAHRDLELSTAQAGMDAYLTKPVGADALARVLSGVAAGDVRGPIDHPARLSRVGGRADLGRTVVATFLGHASRLIDPIDEALGQASAADLRRAAHGLRGALAMVGAQRAADLAGLIEDASLADATRLRDRLAIEIARVTSELELVRDLSGR